MTGTVWDHAPTRCPDLSFWSFDFGTSTAPGESLHQNGCFFHAGSNCGCGLLRISAWTALRAALTWRLLCRRSSPRYTTNRPKKGTSPSIVGRLPSYSFRFTTCFFADRIPQFDPTRDRAELLLDAIALRNPDRRAATPHTLPKPAPRLYMPWTCGSRI